ncbi:MAG: hypothetical protein QHH02_02795 [Syntrophomonadaceae bacterium]|nr:hypothetical protein [Syntrophomonadaceae bacterium]
MNRICTKYFRQLVIGLVLLILATSLGGCVNLVSELPDPASSVPTDKKYPASVFIGTQADYAKASVKGTKAPFPAGQPLFFSVKSFGGFGVQELSAQLVDLGADRKIQKDQPLLNIVIPVEKGKPNALGSIPGLLPGEYQLTIYRQGEDIAARRFLVE